MEKLTFHYVCHKQCRKNSGETYKLSYDVGAYVFVLLKKS